MQKHPDADAFVREYLTRPTSATTRLVFADWLEETGVPHNAAWAYFIRLRNEAERYGTDSDERLELLRQADEYAPKIRAQLTIAASLFVGYPKSLLQLLPASNITVRLANFEVPPPAFELMPESVARENLVLPLDEQQQTLLVATPHPHNYDTVQKLSFILNRDIIQVAADESDVLAAINRAFGDHEYENFDSAPLITGFTDPPMIRRHDVAAEYESVSDPVVRFVNLLAAEAIGARADRILLYPDIHFLGVRYRIDGEWVEEEQVPLRVLRGVTTRLAIMGQIDPDRVFAQPFGMELLTGEFVIRVHERRFRLRVTIQPSPDGPATQLDIAREPTENS
ncbi:TIGR02996 domain-containing protein [Gemmata sp. G18]|uniref:TIGR02996 domain-containing protein n=1 Tax=Gemmata palustris TaxID=2822762 RepID=A0ABS5BTQ2_9BACT|nr:TIGR02996 domain-containing protein [Gemmata palustris]MBP3956802.1 TIGR02996 domain-containing protein [Gemmata palustris]